MALTWEENAIMQTRTLNRIRWLVIIIVCITLVGVVPASAQPTPINIDENKTSEVSAAAPIAEFILSAPTAQGARVQVLALTPGFAPFFTVIDTTTGIPVLDVGIEGSATIVQGNLLLSASVPYLIQVQSANGEFGQFVLSVQAAEVAPGTPLTLGTPISDSVNAASPSKQYGFSADSIETLLLNVDSENPAAGPLVRFRDADSGQTLASISTRLSGVRLSIPPGTQNYVLEVSHSGTPATEAFTVCLETESGTTRCPGSGPVATPEVSLPTETPLPTQPNFVAIPIPATGPCSIAPVGASPINVRSGPSTSFSIVTQLAPNTIVPVTGRNPDSSWYEVSISGLVGWVSATVVRIGGNNCGSITIIASPTPAQPAATPEVTASQTPTPSPTTAGGGTPFQISTLVIVPTFVLAPTLNYSLPPVSGSTALTSGFVPDPYTVGVTAGGPANVSYLGGGCVGYTTAAPSFSLNYTSGAFPTLRFYFVGGGDTTMIINSPNGSYYCVDDSFGTLNPTIDFNSPSSGRYDVWIATYSQGASVGGTLYITENTGNHP